ncbi:DUF6221 family protein [Streptomyces sp. NPDC087866]|uniref:DUF6221 family protein n=1 Tax=Streptomyces sp. NPDC087866 TaxID=3365815 RepID=UPI00380A4521
MNDLVQFLRNRLDEDEHIARTAGSRHKGGSFWSVEQSEVRAKDGTLIVRHTWPDEGAHIARHDPARVLRNVEVGRAALDHYRAVRRSTEKHKAYVLAEGAVGKQIQILALAYADHPNYRDDWRP